MKSVSLRRHREVNYRDIWRILRISFLIPLRIDLQREGASRTGADHLNPCPKELQQLPMGPPFDQKLGPVPIGYFNDRHRYRIINRDSTPIRKLRLNFKPGFHCVIEKRKRLRQLFLLRGEKRLIDKGGAPSRFLIFSIWSAKP